MKIAVIQLDAKANKQNNIDRAVSLVKKAAAQKAKFILLPEVFSFRGRMKTPLQRRDMAENIPGISLRPLMELARQKKVFILAGSVLERVPGAVKVYNTSVLIDDRGKVIAKYRKRNLFDAVFGKKKVKESEQLLAGKRPALTKVGFFNVGLTICYDLRFPELYRSYALKGAHVLCVPSAFTKKTGQAHWEILLRARAIENLCYVLAPDQIGKDSRGVPSYGNSMIIDPWGRIVARASGHREQIIFAHLDKHEIMKARKILPSLGKEFRNVR